MTKQEVTTVEKYKTGLQKMQETFVSSLVESNGKLNIILDDYQRVCAYNMIAKMQDMLTTDGKTFLDIDQNNIINILQTSTMLNLNIAAVPRECYLIFRNIKVGENWKKIFEFGIEGDGNDKVLRKYGVDVKRVHPIWIVREGDEFTYPSFSGIDVTPPTWSPKGYTGKVTKVVYPIEMNDGLVTYHIAERESVIANLQAHISNNLMKAKEADIKAADKAKLLKEVATKDLEELLAYEPAQNWISPAWKNAGSSEAMILRKLRNNCIKKIPKDFTNSFIAKAYETTYEDYEQYEDERISKEEALDVEINENAQATPIDINVTVKGVNDDKDIEVEEEPKKEEVKKEPF
ncbi:MAG: hypothetical protein RR766_04020 [Longicatena sp.]